jgi:putative aldouronate transport system permease protein
MQKEIVTTKKVRTKIRPGDLKLTLMALPFVIYIIAFYYVPIFGWSLAFTNYRPGRTWDKLQFVGLKYFKLIGYYWDDVSNALINTLALSILSIISMVLPMLFAICLNEIRSTKLKKVIQTTVTLPHFVSWVIVYSLMFGIFSTNGMLNMTLEKLNLISKPTQLLANSDIAWTFMTLLGVWKELGWSSIIYLAAIAGIECELYEAAKVDGAGRLARALHITLPGLLPTFIVLLILKIGNLLSVGLQQYLMFSNPVTSHKLDVIDMFTYRIGLLTQDYGFATAVSVLKSFISISLITIANVLAKKVRGDTVI